MTASVKEDVKLRVLLLGSGGREHALAWGFGRAKSVERVFVAPGNGGTRRAGDKIQSVDIALSDFAGLIKFAVEHGVGLVVPGPEGVLVDGIADAFKKVGISVFGPSRLASRIEGSKAFSKDFMKRWEIPSAAHSTFTDYESSSKYLRSVDPTSVVIKASGLAAGKGVVLPGSMAEALDALQGLHTSGNVVIEERLTGPELSILAFSDGHSYALMPPAQDHKRALDGDLGLNTGGMGAYAPAPLATPSLISSIAEIAIQRAIDGMRKEGFPFIGVLYAGVILTPAGPQVLEYNCRFGDPEAQAILPLLSDSCDLAQICLAAANGHLDSVNVEFKKGYSASVVAASHGYPGPYSTGCRIVMGRDMPPDTIVFHAGTTQNANGDLVTAGGRVLAVTSVASNLQNALSNAYKGLNQIQFDGMFYRKDIGWRALEEISKSSSKNTSTKATYAAAGVNIDAGNSLVDRIKALVKTTRRPGSDADLGLKGVFDLSRAGFSGTDTILVAGTDGVGTKLKIAQLTNYHSTIGIDLVAMSVNDLLTQGAEPLFFLDYYATSKLNVETAVQVIQGITDGCRQARCALIGGETAEMPGFYQGDDYDLAGFAVGAVARANVLPKLSTIRPGDIILGLPSSGIHSNGYSLVRHILATSNISYTSPCPWSPAETIGSVLLAPTKIYVDALLPIVKLVKAVSHITGGGFIDNIPRTLPEGFGVKMDVATYPLPEVFRWLKKLGNVDDIEFARTFNCGIGMVLIASPNFLPEILATLKANNEPVFQLGTVVEWTAESGTPRVDISGFSTWN